MVEATDLFRVKVVLTSYFNDHKSKAYVSVNRQWKNVRQLNRHIREIFDLGNFIMTTSDNVYLPNKESIYIIQPGDTIVLFPKNDTKELCALQTSALTEKNVLEMSRGSNTGMVFKLPSQIVTGSERFLSNKSSGLSLSKDEGTESLENSESFFSLSSDRIVGGTKRKRVRRRKKKIASKTSDENVENQNNAMDVQKKKNDSTTAKGSALSKNVLPVNNRHVRFEDSDASASEPDEEIDFPKKARIISANVVGVINLMANGNGLQSIAGESNNADHEKIATGKSIEMQEVCMVEMQPVTESNGNATKMNVETPTAEYIEHSEKKLSALEYLAKNIEAIGKYKELGDDAKENNIIAFKVLTPDFQKSDYVIGLIEGISETKTSQMDCDFTLLIMAGKEHIKHLSVSEFEDDENIHIQISRLDIFDVKLLEL